MEHYHSLEAASGFPWLPKKYTFQTFLRWAQGYFQGAQLKTKRVGGTLCTTEAWVREFLDQLNSEIAKKDGKAIRNILLQMLSEHRAMAVMREACKRELVHCLLDEDFPLRRARNNLRIAVLLADWSMEDFFAEFKGKWDQFPYRAGGTFETFFDDLFEIKKDDPPVSPNTANRQWLAYKAKPPPPPLPKGVPF